jgi:hypothetical protein
MSLENPLWGAPRICSELLLLGFDVAEATVAKYMTRRGRRHPSQTWRTSLWNHLRSTAACDFFVVPTAAWTAQQIVEAFPGEGTEPRYLLRDRDSINGDWFRRRVAGLGIKEIVTAPTRTISGGFSGSTSTTTTSPGLISPWRGMRRSRGALSRRRSGPSLL